MARILIWQDGSVVQDVGLHRNAFTIGRGNECDLQLVDLRVSRRHARICRTAEGFLIEDLDSQNGILVNEEMVRQSTLRDRDRIRIPPFLLQFVIETDAEAQQGPPIVEVIDASKKYPLGKQEVVALSDITLEIYRGEFLALAGPSGSGKSTLLNLIGCIDTPTSGRVRIKGEDVQGKDVDELADLRLDTLGFVFQTFNLLPVLTAEENVEYPLLQKKDIDRAERKQRVQKALEEVGLARFARHRPNEMSGGQRQRVAIARALATRPEIILADEPTANLDHQTGAEILALMRNLNERDGVTFVFSTHDPRVMEMANRVVQLTDGRIID